MKFITLFSLLTTLAFASPVWVDVNGDGHGDRCGRYESGIACRVSINQHRLTDLRYLTYNFSNIQDWNKDYYGQTVRFGYVNRDGFSDVCGRGADGIRCALSDGNRNGYLTRFNEWTVWARAFTNAEGWADPRYYSTIQLADLNGDGVADIYGYGPRGYEYCISNGVDRFTCH